MARPDFAAQEVQDRSFELTDQIAGFRPGAATPEEALVTDTVAELGNLIGGSVAGAELRDASDSDHGLFLQYTGADSSWHLRGRAREAGSPAVAAALSFDNQDEDGSLAVSLPLDWAASPATASGIAITYNRYATPVSEVKAFYTYGPLRITSRRDGSSGDSDVVRITGGTAAVASHNAQADIEGSRGATPGHDGVIRVTSPDATGTVDEVAGVNPQYDTNAAFMNVRALVPGTAMNGFTLAMRSVRDNSQTETITWAATYSADNRTLNIVATLNTFDLFAVSTEGLVDAINAARTAQGEQLVEANRVKFDTENFISINYIRSNENPLRNITGLVLSGGTHASGPGTATNRGEVRVVSSAARVPGTAATYVWQISSGRQITLTFHEVGVAGNNLQFSTRQDTTNLNANTVDASDTGADFLLRYNGSVTLGTIIDELNGNTSRFTATITQGSRADSVTPSGNNTWRTSGGVDTVNPLSAVWDANAHRLTVTALASDTFDEVRTAIIALSQFQTGDGTNAGDVVLADAALTSDTIDVPATAGQHVDYDFSGGVDAMPRTDLVVSDAAVSGTVSRFMISGLIASDSVQDVLDAYSGSRFTLGTTSGSSASDTFTVTDVNDANLANGLDEVTRQLPSVTLADNGAITISLHAVDDRSDNTTLNELRSAFLGADYTDTAGDPQKLVAAALTLNFAGGGTGTDPLRNQTLPASPSGGVDHVGAGPIEAVVNADDSYVEIRYLPAEDTLEDVLTALKEQNLIKASAIYGTTLGNTPEDPPFDKTMHRDAANIDIVGEGTDLDIGARTATSLVVTSSTGDDATIPSATTSRAGLMSRNDKRTVNATPPAWSAGSHAVGDQVSYGNKIYVCLATRTGSDTSNPSADTTGWAVVGTGSGGGGLASVAHDNTLTGDGTSGDPLKVANPFTDADETKLDGIDDNATDDQTGAEIKDALEGLTGANRLAATAIKDLPSGGGDAITGALPQAITGSASVNNLSVGSTQDITVSAVAGSTYAEQGTGGDADKIVIASPGTYRLYGGIVVNTSTDRTAPALTVDGTGVTPIGFSESYLRDADTAITVLRYVDFIVANANTVVTLQVLNRVVLTSGSGFGIQDVDVTGVSDLRLVPIAGVAGPAGTGNAVETDATLTGDGTSGDTLKVANPFTADDESKLDGIAPGAEVNVQSDWNQSTTSADDFIKNKPTDAEIGDKAFKNPPSLDSTQQAAVRTAIGAGTGSGGGGTEYNADNRLNTEFVGSGKVSDAELDTLDGNTFNIHDALHLGIFEINTNTLQSIQDSLRIAARSDSSIGNGDKWVLSGDHALKNRIIRLADVDGLKAASSFEDTVASIEAHFDILNVLPEQIESLDNVRGNVQAQLDRKLDENAIKDALKSEEYRHVLRRVSTGLGDSGFRENIIFIDGTARTVGSETVHDVTISTTSPVDLDGTARDNADAVRDDYNWMVHHLQPGNEFQLDVGDNKVTTWTVIGSNQDTFNRMEVRARLDSGTINYVNHSEDITFTSIENSLTGESIGELAFENPPADLTDDQKAAARNAIGAGSGAGLSEEQAEGLAQAVEVTNVTKDLVSVTKFTGFTGVASSNLFTGTGRLIAAAKIGAIDFFYLKDTDDFSDIQATFPANSTIVVRDASNNIVVEAEFTQVSISSSNTIVGQVTYTTGSAASITVGDTYSAEGAAELSIGADQIANGSVSNAEFQTLNNISTSVTLQAQLDSKLDASPTDVGDIAFSNPPTDLDDTEKAAVRNAIGAGTGDGSGDGRVGLFDFDDLPDAADYEDGAIEVREGVFYRKETAHSSNNTFAGHVGSGQQTIGGVQWRGAATRYANDYRPALVGGNFHATGSFNSNPGGDIGFVLASANGDSTGDLYAAIRKSAYDAAKGSAYANGDTLDFVFGRFNSSLAGETITVTGIGTYMSDGVEWVVFSATNEARTYHLFQQSGGGAFSFTVNAAGSSTPFLTHTAEVEHWVHWIDEDTVEDQRSIATLQEQLQAEQNRAAGEEARIRLAIDHVKIASGQPFDPFPADPDTAAAMFLVEEGLAASITIPAARSRSGAEVAYTPTILPGQYNVTTGPAANTIVARIDYALDNQVGYYGIYEHRGWLDAHFSSPDAPDTVGEFLHNPLSGLIGLGLYHVIPAGTGYDSAYQAQIRVADWNLYTNNGNSSYIYLHFYDNAGTYLNKHLRFARQAHAGAWGERGASFYNLSNQTQTLDEFFKTIYDNNPTDSDADKLARTVRIVITGSSSQPTSSGSAAPLQIGNGKAKGFTLQPLITIAKQLRVVPLTQAQYDALSEKESNVFYDITDA